MRWTKPLVGIVKLNWDAAVDKNLKKIGVGIIVCDHEGSAIMSKCMTRTLISDPTVAEAYGAWSTMEFSSQLGLNKVILEGDSLEIVKALPREESSWNPRYGHLIDDAKNILHNFQVLSVNHVKRSANEVAHRLAKRP